MAEQSKQVKPAEKAGEIQRPRAAGRALSPFDEMERMMDRMFADFFPRSFLRPFGWPSVAAEWEPQVPRVDVVDREEDVLVRAELPGVQKKDLDVAIRDSAVTIKANVEREEKEEQGDYYRRERRRGSFARTVELPAEVDGTKAKASLKDGILELTLPKVERARAHHISIE